MDGNENQRAQDMHQDLQFVRAPMPLVERAPTPPKGLEDGVHTKVETATLQRAGLLGLAVAAIVIGLIENGIRFSDPASLASTELQVHNGLGAAPVETAAVSEARREDRLVNPFR